jgi:cell division protein FtsW (lipid II flippase)
VVGEELGLVGALIVVFVFAIFLWRGLRLLCARLIDLDCCSDSAL